MATRIRSKKTKKLTPKQEMFVREYLVDLNATQACIRAGYKAPNADRIGPELLGIPWVAEAIQQGMAARAARIEINADWVLERLVKIADFDPRKLHDSDGSIKTVDKWGDDVAAAVASLDVAEIFDGQGEQKFAIGLSKKVRTHDKLKALELIGKHIAMFTDKTEITGKDGGPIETKEVSQEEAARKLAFALAKALHQKKSGKAG